MSDASTSSDQKKETEDKILKLLMIDDSEIDAGLIFRVLEHSGYVLDITRVDNPADLQTALANQSWDVVLSDYSMPQFTGLDALEVVKTYDANMPFILISGTIGEEVAVQAIHAGASDYLLKDRLTRLVPAIERAIRESEEHRTCKQAEKKLAFIAKEWQTTFDATNDVIWILDKNQRIVRSNKTSERLFPYSCDELIGKHCWEVVHGSSNPLPECPTHRAREHLQRETQELQIEARWFEVTVDPILDTNGQYEGAVHIVSDITERKHAEENLRLANEHLRRFVDANILGVLVANAAGEVLEANDYYLNLIGFTQEDLKAGKVDWRAITPPEWLPADEKAIRELYERGTCTPYEKEYIRRDGRRITVLLADALLPGPEEQIAAFALDQTERKRAEHDLIASETRYRRLFESAKDGILILDADSGKIVDVNPFLIQMLGFDLDYFMGKDLWEIGLFKDIAASKAAFLALQEKEYVRYENLPLKTKDGRRVEVEFVSNVYSVDSSKVVQCNIRNITDRKQAEDRDRLARMVLELLNRPSEAVDTIGEILRLIKTSITIEAAGIRLKEGDDYPYFETSGFSYDFLCGERFLCKRDEAGNLIRDRMGNPVLECMCGNILQGRTDPTLPFFTARGSFWTNSTTKMLATTTEAEGQATTRNRCNEEGYESVALIPLRSSGKIIGLLQLNDHQPNRFTLELIHFFEELGASIGIALARQQAEETLRESATLLRIAGRTTRLGGWMVNVVTNQTIWSDEVAIIHDMPPGYSPSATEGTIFYAPEWKEKIKKVHAACVQEGIPYDEEMEIITAKGRRAWVRTIGEAIRDESGTIVRVQGSFQDITDRKETEEALALHTRRVQALLDLQLLSYAQKTQVLDYVLDACLNMTQSEYSFIGTMDETESVMTIHRWSREVMEECALPTQPITYPICSAGLWGDCIRERKPVICNDYQAPHLNKKGLPEEHVPIHRFVAVPVMDENRIVAVAAVANKTRDYNETDVNALTALLQKMWEIVSRQQRELERIELEDQYRQAQKMEAVGQLAGGVAHDFNNILQAMIGYSSMLLDRLPEHDDMHEYAEEIAKGAERAATLTRQLLAFSRRQILEMEDLDLNEVLNNMAKMLRRIISENIELETIENHHLALIHADRGQMEQVLLNLCINARDAMAEGGSLVIETANVEIDRDYCDLHAWATPGHYVLLSITDTGCGMDAQIQAHIFEPFYTTKESGKGTGLGLATVYGIVRQHQGMVHVYSEPGKGTTFKVYLPSVESTTATPKIASTSPARGGTETILIAEDDETLRKLTTHLLKEAGYTLLLAIDGEEALDMYEKNSEKIDLLLLDIIMPKRGGKGVYDVLHQQNPRLRFLFTSGYSTTIIHTDFVLKEGIDLLQKPYAPDTLLHKVREILDRKDADQNADSD